MTKQPHPETDYFGRIDVEKRRKIAMHKHAQMAEAELAQLKKTHYMHCAGCGWELETMIFQGIPIHKCFHCGGAFLEEEAIDKFLGKDTKFIETIIELFRF